MRPRLWLLLAALTAVFVLAYALRDSIERTVVRPAAYVWWVLGLYYRSFPQVAIWIALIALLAMLAVRSLVAETPPEERETLKRLSVQGPVESLATWITNAQRGIYFKWLVAQRLGILSRAILSFNARLAPRSGREALQGPGWDPPQEVAAYLESGLNGSFADFPRPRWPFQPLDPTPLDTDPVKVMDYIESQMEKS